MIRWIFRDPYTPRQVTLPVNPAQMGSPFPQRKVTSFATTAGRILTTEGSRDAAQWTFGGVILTKAHYDIFYDFFYGDNANRRILITDHLGRKFTCVPVSWSPEPRTSAVWPWRHTFQATVMVVGYDFTGTIGDV